jgi:hypothetical protein
MSELISDANSEANSALIPEPIPPKRKRGNPNLRKGGPSLNPTGKPKAVDRIELEAAQAELAELRAKLEDQGLKGEVKMLRAKVAEYEKAEAERAAAPVGRVKDPGAAKALEQIEAILNDVEQQAREEEEQFVKDGLCAVCGQKPIPQRGKAGRIIGNPSYGRAER